MVQEQGRVYSFYENLEAELTEREKKNNEKVTVQSQETSRLTDVKSIVYEAGNRGEIIKKEEYIEEYNRLYERRFISF